MNFLNKAINANTLFKSKQALYIYSKFNFSTITELYKNNQDRVVLYNESKRKQTNKRKRREKHMNQSDPNLSGERPLQNWSEKKGKTLYKFINDYANINRISRKPIPEKEKQEYIEKSKEMNLFFLDQFRRKNHQINLLKQSRQGVLNTLTTLPYYLTYELETGKAVYQEEHPYCKDIEEYEKKNLQFTSDFLYFEQMLRLLPDEARSLEKVARNAFTDNDIVGKKDPDRDVILFNEDNIITDQFGHLRPKKDLQAEEDKKQLLKDLEDSINDDPNATDEIKRIKENDVFNHMVEKYY